MKYLYVNDFRHGEVEDLDLETDWVTTLRYDNPDDLTTALNFGAYATQVTYGRRRLTIRGQHINALVAGYPKDDTFYDNVFDALLIAAGLKEKPNVQPR